MIIQHNMLSMFTDRNLRITTGSRAKTSERLSSGYRINRASDDAAGLSISEKLRSLVRGHNRAADNVQDGISLLQVADGALNEVHNSLHRMSELAVQAANDTNTDADREKLQDEIDAIKNEINRISTDTEFNTLKIFNFEEEDGIDLEAFRGGPENYAINSRDVSTPTQAVTFPPSSLTITNINPYTQAYIPSLTSSNDISGGYGMEADETGIRMYLPAKYNPAGTGKVYFDLKTWAQLGSSGTYTYEMKINDKSVNLGSIVFTMDSEASRQEIIDSINNWQLDVVPNNRMNFNISTNDTSGATISHKEHSVSLDTYGTHYAMGRNMKSTLQMTFPNGQGMTISGNNLSFTMADANSKQYTFTATNARAAIENEVTAAFRTYITNYQQAYQTAYDNYLQTAAGKNNPNSFTFNGNSIKSPTPSGLVTFYDNANGHSVTLSFTGKNVFSGILTQNDFTRSYTGPDNSGRLTGYVNPNSGLTTTYQTQINAITDKIYNSFKGININSITATSLSPTRGVLVDVKIKARVPDVNPPIETVTPDGSKLRKLMIQAGPNTKQAIGIDLPPMNTTILKIGSVNVSTYDGASTAIGQISGAVEYISDMRSGYGATQNRLEHAFAINNISEENAQAAESRIRDTDMAEELVIYSKNNILIQAAQSVLSQSNQTTEMVLSLLQ